MELSNGCDTKALNVTYEPKQPALEWYTTILSGRWKRREDGEYMYYYCHAENGEIAVLMTYVDHIILGRDYEEETQGMFDRLYWKSTRGKTWACRKHSS